MNRPNAPQVEKVGAQIFSDCLIADGSLLTPGKQIWTSDNLAELHANYIGAPDVSAKSFSEKLAIQLEPCSPGARQLFAEIYVLNILPVVNFLESTKIRVIEEVLAPLHPPVGLTPDLLAAFSEGVFHGGPAWSSRRWAQLSFLVEFAEYFKSQDPTVRAAAATDPEALRKLVMDSPGQREPAQRQALLYTFQPRYYLPIVSNEHRGALRATFAAQYLPNGPSKDVDADLRTIVDGIEKDAGGPVDLYDDMWKPKWFPEPHPGKKAETGGHAKVGGETESSDTPYTVADIVAEGSFHSKERLQTMLEHWKDNQNLVLQGAPGTGKTWLARRLAQALIGSLVPGAIRSVQFHPNTSYEDFVRGWRPKSGELELVDGALLQHAERARSSPDVPHVLVIEEINRGNPAQAFGEMLTLIERSKRNPDDALSLSYPKFDGEEYYLPDNLYLLGTMNIADRSLALVDLALRRRFSFETLEPAFTDAWASYLAKKLPNDAGLVETIRSRISDLNTTIEQDPMLGPNFLIGQSFLTPLQTQSDGKAWYLGVVDTQIGPQLQEYWFDAREKADAAIAALKA
ncbi:MAG: AAA family ATPase [Nocardiaceae bacterium]|nr:AAA family ATPase [Nocardiaceae bacterium]